MNLRACFSLAAGLLVPVLTAAQPGPARTVLAGTGSSMLPTLPEACRLVVVRVPFGDIRVGENDGDIVVTRLRGIRVIHRAVGRRADGSLITRGDNNPGADALATTEENYIGVVHGFEEPGEVGQLTIPSARRSGSG